MVMSALESFMTKVSWAPLDVLVIDMPPGTGGAFSFFLSNAHQECLKETEDTVFSCTQISLVVKRDKQQRSTIIL